MENKKETQKTIFNIKKNGSLIALDSCHQYWLYDNTVYSISITGKYFSFWCAVSKLTAHLVRLYQVTGKKYFSDDPDMVITDKKFFANYIYA